MSEQVVHTTHDRSAAKSRTLAKLHRYKGLLASKWWVLLLGLILGPAVAFGLIYIRPPLFTSVGRMIVSIKLSIPEGSAYTEEMSNFLGTQAALMQGGTVINRAHEMVLAKSRDNTQEMQAVGLKVNVLPKTTIFVLQATGTNQAYTRAFLQECMTAYVDLKKSMREKTSDTTLAGLTEEVLRQEKELKRADEDLVQFQSSNSVVLLQEQGNSAGAWLASLNQRLALLKSEYELLQTLTLDQSLERRQQPGGNGGGVAADDLLTRATRLGGDAVESDYLKAKQQILLLKADRDEMAQYLRPKHPKMVAMAEEIARRERLLEIFRQQSSEQLESRKSSLSLQIQNVEKDIKEWDAKTLEISRKTAEFQRLKANAQRIQVLYDRLLATMQTLDVNKEISPESVTIMEPASPAMPNRPELSKQLITGGVVGFVIGILILALIDRLDDRMSSFTELQELFDEDVLAQIPREKPQTRKGAVALISQADERHSFVEAYRNLRSSLLFKSGQNERPRAILLTSSVPNEGKSLTSANLAITLANGGARVLLVDCDLRKGSLHHRFDQPAEPGVTEVLSEGFDWEKAVRTTRVPNLSLLPRGSLTQRSSEFFLSPATDKFLKETTAKYDIVLVDTAPVMAADDVTSLAPKMDTVVFVIRAEHTSARVARAALEALYQRQAHVTGLIFNAVRPTSTDYYYYYKYKDYYHKYPAGKSSSKREAETVS
jgi:capsular exopolysaccharide synthesis family protein